ncbi:hypothetical protein EU528_01635 [Candidatus Thorarchaeota archaeon]|nr:MAG: hypothetical protein EU528_01635 [Candidatus Thorarchaeota archaeon]
MKRLHVSKVLLFALMFLLVASLSPATAFTISGDDTTTETEDKTEETHTDDDKHDLDEYRDTNGTVWIETDVMTVTLDPKLPIYQYWYTGDENGSLARFMISYKMIVEFEDSNGDGIYQPNETLAFVPLDAFEWSLQTGEITNDLNEVTEVYASYTKGGLSYKFEDDWYEEWMPEIEEEEEEPVILASEDPEDHAFADFAGMTLRFYGHVYTTDYFGNVSDDFGVESNYTVAGGMELKVDIEIGNFPFISETSKVAVLNYLIEDVASSGEYEHSYELHEKDGDNEVDSEDVSDIYGIGFEDRDENHDGQDDDIQQISVVDGTNNLTRGLYSWLDKAIITDLNGTETAVDVDTSYWTDGEGLLLFFAYPNFDGGSLLHDPALRLLDTGSPIIQPTGILNLPMETITLIGVASAVVIVAIAGFAIKRR